MDIPPHDTWREISRRAGEGLEGLHRKSVRFSRVLLVGGALFLILISLADLLA